MRRRKWLALFLCGALAFSNLGTVAYASGETVQVDAGSVEAAQEEMSEPTEVTQESEPVADESSESLQEGETAESEPVEIEAEETQQGVEAEEVQEEEPADSALAAEGTVTYYDPESEQEVEATDVTSVTAETKAFYEGFYAVEGAVTVNQRIVVNGDAKLILKEACSFTAPKGIQVSAGNKLTIYAETEEGTGELIAYASNTFNAVIGGNQEEAAGEITICGGEITVYGTNSGAAIGSGSKGKGGLVTIHGGVVAATIDQIPGEGEGKREFVSAGIGSGNGSTDACKVMIDGGTVNAEGGYGAAGIGAGWNAAAGAVNIEGDSKIVAVGGAGAAGICGSQVLVNDFAEAMSFGGGTENIGGKEVHAGVGVEAELLQVMGCGYLSALGGTVEESANTSPIYYNGAGIDADTIQLSEYSETIAESGGIEESLQAEEAAGIETNHITVTEGSLKAFGGSQAISVAPEIDEKYFHVTFGNTEGPDPLSKIAEMTGLSLIGEWANYKYLEIVPLEDRVDYTLTADPESLTVEKRKTAEVCFTLDFQVDNDLLQELSEEDAALFTECISRLEIAIDDENIAKITEISEDGKTVTVKGVGEGTAKLTATAPNGISEACCEVNVVANPSTVYYFCSMESSHKKAENVQYIDEDTKKLTSGFYAVTGEVTSSASSIEVVGDVSIILMDGCVFDSCSVNVTGANNSLTIYGETPEGTGQMIVRRTGSMDNAVLGGKSGRRAGDITIDGGTITVYGANTGAAIGSGANGNPGDIAIWGGTICAYNSTNGAAIGSGASNKPRDDGTIATIEINGGNVTATTEYMPKADGTVNEGRRELAGPGIGSGNKSQTPYNIQIYDGFVSAYGGLGSAGIGSGNGSTEGDLTVYGGSVYAYGGTVAPGVRADNITLRGDGYLLAEGGGTAGAGAKNSVIYAGDGIWGSYVTIWEDAVVDAYGGDVADDRDNITYYAGSGINAGAFLMYGGDVETFGGDICEGVKNYYGYGVSAVEIIINAGYLEASSDRQAFDIHPEGGEYTEPNMYDYNHVTYGNTKNARTNKVIEMTGYPLQEGDWSDYKYLRIVPLTDLMNITVNAIPTELTMDVYGVVDILFNVDVSFSEELPELPEDVEEELIDFAYTLEVFSDNDKVVHVARVFEGLGYYRVTLVGLESAARPIAVNAYAVDGTVASCEVTVKNTPEPTPEPKPSAKEKATGQLQGDLQVKWSDGKMAVSWGKVAGADGYDIFAEKCGNTMNSKDLVKSVKKSKTSVTIAKLAGKKFSSTANYKVKVKAYKLVNNKKKYVASSYVMHIVGGKHKKYTNAKKVTVTKTSYSLAVGKTAKISAKITLNDKPKKALPKKHVKKLRYWSTNSKVASVNASGKITAKAQGSCYVYVAAADGAKKKIKVTVK